MSYEANSRAGTVEKWQGGSITHIRSFTAHPEDQDEYHVPEWLTEQFAATPRKPLHFYVQTGQIEWLLAPNRRFAASLVDKEYPYSYEGLPSGHNWSTWEQGLEPGLSFLFGAEVK